MSLFVRGCRFLSLARNFLNLKQQGPKNHCKFFSSETSLSIGDAKVKRYLDNLAVLYDKKQLDNHVASELFNLQPVATLLRDKLKMMGNIEALKDLASNDEETKEMVRKEQRTYTKELEKIDQMLLDTLASNLNAHSYKSIVVEIVAGVGGQEAMLFVRDLYNMYIGYLNYLGLDYEVMELDDRAQGGIRKSSIVAKGEDALEKLKYEGGVHRVQRIPSTEHHGRLHTSTASVTVLPEPSDIEIALPEKDLSIETKRASGAGGQHVNTTDSAVRVVHIPSGTIVTCQIDRSQLKNKEWALRRLKSILYDRQLNKQATFISELRKKQMGMKSRNEKIRTYNFNQDRVTDHRIPNGTMHDIKEFMQGGAALEELEDRLHRNMQRTILLEIMEKSEDQFK